MVNDVNLVSFSNSFERKLIFIVFFRVKKQHLLRTYDLEDYDDADDFMEKLARKSGKLLKKGEPDIPTMAKMLLNDFQRG